MINPQHPDSWNKSVSQDSYYWQSALMTHRECMANRNVAYTHTRQFHFKHILWGKTSILATANSLHDVQFKASTHIRVSVRREGGGRNPHCHWGCSEMFFFTVTGRVHITIYRGGRGKRSVMNQYNPLSDIYDRDPNTPNHIQFSVKRVQLQDSVLSYSAPLQCKQGISLSFCCPRIPHQATLSSSFTRPPVTITTQ